MTAGTAYGVISAAASYESADSRHMAVGAIEPQFYTEFVRLLGLGPDLPDRGDPGNWTHWRKRFAEAFCTRTLAEWTAGGQRRGEDGGRASARGPSGWHSPRWPGRTRQRSLPRVTRPWWDSPRGEPTSEETVGLVVAVWDGQPHGAGSGEGGRVPRGIRR